MNADRKYFIMQPVTVSGGGSRVLAAGGAADSPCSCIRNTAELYNESTNTWTNTATNMNAARVFQASSVLSDGRVLVTGGDSNTSGTNTLASTEIYDPVADTWTTKASMNTAREAHTQVTFTDSSGNSKVMVIGGINGTGRLSSTEIYDPSANTWSAGPSLSYARNSFAAVLIHDGRILVVGGDPTAYTHSEVYNPTTNSWTTYTTPSWTGWNSAVVLGAGANYRVLTAGGRNTYIANAMWFDPTTNSWSTTTSMNTARGYLSLTALSDGTVLAAGGQGSSGYFNTSEKFTP
jgi:N-acetylneuraminic acid mutarotase